MPPELTRSLQTKFFPQPLDFCDLDRNQRPQLVVVIDTEEEFDWSADFSRNNTAVQCIRLLSEVQVIFDEYHIRPVYAIDYPVVSQPDGFKPLQEIWQDDRCVIGAHLHPWVNPPFEEEVTRYHSFPGNLPSLLEKEKLKRLGDCIEEHFGHQPLIYKAGRYGTGPNTAEVLTALGYEVDVTVLPRMNWSAEGGPDFTYAPVWPYWFGQDSRLLEIPITAGFTGLLKKHGNQVYRWASSPQLEACHAVGVLSRLHLLDKIRLTPEGFTFFELKRLVKSLTGQGLNVFNLAFHSTSLEPGRTPYVRSKQELEKFLACCRNFFEFFFGELGGQPSTPLEVKKRLRDSAASLGAINAENQTSTS